MSFEKVVVANWIIKVQDNKLIFSINNSKFDDSFENPEIFFKNLRKKYDAIEIYNCESSTVKFQFTKSLINILESLAFKDILFWMNPTIEDIFLIQTISELYNFRIGILSKQIEPEIRKYLQDTRFFIHINITSNEDLNIDTSQSKDWSISIKEEFKDYDFLNKKILEIYNENGRVVVSNVKLCKLKYPKTSFYAQLQASNVMTNSLTTKTTSKSCENCTLRDFCKFSNLENLDITPFLVDKKKFLKNIFEDNFSTASDNKFYEIHRKVHSKIATNSKNNLNAENNIYSTYTEYLISKNKTILTDLELKEKWSKFDKSREKNSDEDLMLYISVPFCKSTCKFCIYPSKICLDQKIIDDYLNFLIKKIEFFSTSFKNSKFTAVTIGGGTPTIFSESQLEKLFNSIFTNFKFIEHAHKAIEVGPTTCTIEKLKVMKEYNFNKISIGVQSMHEDVLLLMNRNIKPKDIKAFFEMVSQFDNFQINVDFIMGLEGDTPEKLLDSFIQISKYKPDLITFYPLKISKNKIEEKVFSSQQSRQLIKFHRLFSQLLKENVEQQDYFLENLNEPDMVSSIKPIAIRNKDFKLITYKYSNFTTEPSSLLAIGHFGISHIKNEGIVLNVQNSNQDLMFLKDFPDDYSAFNNLFSKYHKDYDKIKYIIGKSLFHFQFSRSEYKYYFKNDVLEDFHFTFDLLKYLNLVTVSTDTIKFKATTEIEFDKIINYFLETKVFSND